MTARVIRFPELFPAHTPRPAPAVVVMLPVVRIAREPAQHHEPDFICTDFPLIDGSLTRGADD